MKGYHEFGRRLAEVVAERFCFNVSRAFQVLPSDAFVLEADSGDFVHRLLQGAYVKADANHGRPTYRKLGAEGTTRVILFYWDASDGAEWNGWWFGPKLDFDHPGWAFHASTAAQPPSEGWTVPPRGSVSLLVVVQPCYVGFDIFR